MNTSKQFGVAFAAVLLLACVPAFAGASVVDKLTTLFIYMLLATTWNLMAGYAGLVSVGQQAFFGLGGYFALRLVDGGLPAYPALLAGAVGAALLAWVLSFYVLRLKDGEFAIGTWVVAEVIRILVMLDPLIQGETGTSLIALNAVEPELRRSIGYWFALAALAGMALAMAVLLRSHVGTAAKAIGDDDEAAASLGVRVLRTRQAIYVLAAFGAALAGVAWLASAITFLPRTNFGVQWSVLMLFMVLVGGLRSGPGPYIGALLLFALQEFMGDFGAWYLAGLGAAAAGCALFLPQGLWGALSPRLARLFTQPCVSPVSPPQERTAP
ncbi:MAG: branched-chain amino acid ABC transporter permease [Hydrogenophaga sp.]|uniref:branched-chain amino acid ABC transporter permease n=1 Tax=Hydrogenophaga sp. TaxID=1904254 RepID=UPI002730B0FE|nr:branched-chain amino acid ABC transporter permease [Hydrogenophaga sp.]MDP2407122.1 branched-chain amino acid ABC transporter permease [Hydrogenophaga sp.]MDZ4172848.1 branched-chain amino acid ABC transporter permease [Hydrogenophaga sp.]